jgi:outer membrane protein TolC
MGFSEMMTVLSRLFLAVILYLSLLTFGAFAWAKPQTSGVLERPPTLPVQSPQSIVNLKSTANKTVLALSLKEAIALALRENLSARNAYLSRLVDRFALNVANDAFKPHLSMVANSGYNALYNATTSRHNTNFDQSVGGNASLRLPTGGEIGVSVNTAHTNNSNNSNGNYATNVNVNVSQPLLRGGGLTVGQASLVSAQRSEISSQLSFRDSLSSVVNTVIRQYRSYVSSTRALRIDELSMKRAEDQLETQQALLDAGRIARFGLVQSQADLARQKLNLQSSKNALRAEEVNLLRTLRLPAETALRLDSTIQLKPLPTLTLEKMIKLAFQQRVDYQQVKLALADSKLGLKLAENAQLWDLNVAASYALSGSANDITGALNDIVPDTQGDYAVGVNLTVPLGENLSQKQSLLSARVALLKTRNSLIELEEDIRLELTRKREEIQLLWQQIPLSKEALKLTQQELENERIKLNAGSSDNDDLINVNDRLIRSENSHVSLQLAYLNALTDLDDALGVTLSKWGISINAEISEDQLESYSIQRR